MRAGNPRDALQTFAKSPGSIILRILHCQRLAIAVPAISWNRTRPFICKIMRPSLRHRRMKSLCQCKRLSVQAAINLTLQANHVHNAIIITLESRDGLMAGPELSVNQAAPHLTRATNREKHPIEQIANKIHSNHDCKECLQRIHGTRVRLSATSKPLRTIAINRHIVCELAWNVRQIRKTLLFRAGL